MACCVPLVIPTLEFDLIIKDKKKTIYHNALHTPHRLFLLHLQQQLDEIFRMLPPIYIKMHMCLTNLMIIPLMC